MAKSTLKKALSLVLSVMLILSALSGAILTVAAEEVAGDPEWAGTEADGIANGTNNTTVGFANGDFSKGLKYWGVRFADTLVTYVEATDEVPAHYVTSGINPSYPSNFVTLETEENGNKYIQFKPNAQEWEGLISNVILVSEEFVKEGDFVGALYKQKGTTASQIRVEQRDYAGEDRGISVTGNGDMKIGTDADGWTYYLTPTKGFAKAVGPRYEGSNGGQSNSGYFAFHVEIANAIKNRTEVANGDGTYSEYTEGEAVDLAIDDIELVKLGDDGNFYYLDGTMAVKVDGKDRENPTSYNAIQRTIVKTGEAFYSDALEYQPVGGTEEGIIKDKGDDTNYITEEAQPMNLDFSDGFKFWLPKDDRLGKPTDMFDVSDGIMSFKTENHTIYNGIVSVRFKIPGVQAGDKVVLAVKYKASAQIGGAALYQYDASGAEVKGEGICSPYPANLVASENWRWNTTFFTTVDSADSTFRIFFQDNRPSFTEADETTITASFDEFIIGKELPDGTLFDYITKERYFKSGQPFGGTEEEGVAYRDGGITTFPATEGFLNGDFSEGLKYWGNSVGSNGTDATLFNSVKDGALVFDKVTGDWQGVNSQMISLPDVLPEDEVSIMFDVRNTGTAGIQVKLIDRGYDTTSSLGELYKTTHSNSSNEWKTFITNPATGLTATEKFTMVLAVNNVGAKGAEVDNIKFVKHITDANDPTVDRYVDFEGNIVYDVYEARFGTYKDGLSSAAKDVIEYGFNNGDFSDGFKFWTSNASNIYASDRAQLIEEDGNNYVKYFGSTEKTYQPLSTPYVAISDKLVKNGDNLVMVFKYKGSNLGVQFEFAQINASSGNYVKLFQQNVETSRSQCYVQNIGTTSDGWNIAYTYKPNTPTSLTSVLERAAGTKVGQADSGYYAFQFLIKNVYTETDMYFDDFQFAKLDTATGALTALDGTPITFTDVHGSTDAGMFGVAVDKAPAADGIGALSFSEGLKYWGGMNGGGAALKYADDQVKLTTEEDGSKVIGFYSDTAKWDGIRTKFAIDDLKVGESIALNAEYTDLTAGGLRIRLFAYTAEGTQLSAVQNGNIAFTDTDWAKIGTGYITITEDVAYFVAEVQYTTDPAADVTEVKIRNLRIIKRNITPANSYQYLDDETGTIYSTATNTEYYGTEKDGILTNSNHIYHKAEVLKLPLNLDFSQGLKYWFAKDHTGYTSEIASVVDGRLYVENYKQYGGLFSFFFSPDKLNAGDTIYIGADVQSSVKLGLGIRYVYTLNGANKEGDLGGVSIGGDANAALTGTSGGMVIPDHDAGSLKLYLRLQHSTDPNGELGTVGAYVDNILLTKKDAGGADKKVNIDGTLLEGDKYGDANGDGKVDILDLVRMKKHAADTSTTIFFAASDVDANDAVDAYDLAEVIKYLIGAINEVVPVK